MIVEYNVIKVMEIRRSRCFGYLKRTGCDRIKKVYCSGMQEEKEKALGVKRSTMSNDFSADGAEDSNL